MNIGKLQKVVGIGLSAALIGLLLPLVSPVLAADLNLTRTLPATVEPGEEFTVTVTLTATDDLFNSIGVTDFAPNGWYVSVNKVWCTPEADFVNDSCASSAYTAEILWYGGYDEGDTLTAVYKVTVPDNVVPGFYGFAAGTTCGDTAKSHGWLTYQIGTDSPVLVEIDDDTVEVEKPDEVWVDDDWDGKIDGDDAGSHVFGYDAFATIQDGIDGVAASTVHVLAGTYAAFNMTGRADLDILGETGAVVNASDTFGGSVSPTMAWVEDSTDILIDGLEFDDSGDSATYGIYYDNSTGAINGVYVHAVVGSSPTGKGILVEGATQTVAISDSTIEDCEACVDVADDTVTLTDCTIIGMDGIGSESAGIVARSGASVTAEGCEIKDCVATNVTAPGKAPWEDGDGCGVYVYSGATVVMGSCCMIHDNEYGIYVVDGGDLTANGNSIYDNTQYGLYSEVSAVAPGLTVEPIDAEENWWGDVSGPTHGDNPSGTGDDVHGYVDFWPWLDGPCPDGAALGPNAEFSGTPRSGEAVLCVDFTDESLPWDSCVIDEWLWDFGDGESSTEQDPTHCYEDPGMYTVSLTVTDDCDESDTETKLRYIVVGRVQEEGIELGGPGTAKMVVCYLDISPQEVVQGQELEISVNVCNQGEQKGSRNVALMINGYPEQSQTVVVSPGSCQTVVFRTFKTVPGSYEVWVEGATGSFSVMPLYPGYVVRTAPAQQGGGIGTAGIVTIVVVLIVLAGGLVLILRRE